MIVMEIMQFNKRCGGLCCKKSKDQEADQTASTICNDVCDIVIDCMEADD